MKKTALIVSLLLVVAIGFLTPCAAQREKGGIWVIGPLALSQDDALLINILNVSDFVVDGSLQFYDRNGRLIGDTPILWDDKPPPTGPRHVLFADSDNPTIDPSINRVAIDYIDGVTSITDPELQPVWVEIKTYNRSATKVLLPTSEVRYGTGPDFDHREVISALPIPLP